MQFVSLFVFIAGILIFILLMMILSSRQKASPQALVDEEIVSFVDSNLKGYPDRVHYRDVNAVETWSCHSRLFGFSVFLSKKSAYRLTCFYYRDLPFRFEFRKQKFIKVSGQDTERLIAEKEMPGLLEKLSFYDSVEVSRYGLKVTRSFHELNDLSEWPKAFGASITLLRFILSFQNRKEPVESSASLCPYCREIILKEEKVVSCNACRTLHHEDCWKETDLCSVFGCGSRSELRLEQG